MLPPEIIERIREREREQERRRQPSQVPLQISDEVPPGWRPEAPSPAEEPRGITVIIGGEDDEDEKSSRNDSERGVAVYQM